MKPKIYFQCPSCQARISAPRELLGKRRNCPGCGNSFVIRKHPGEKRDTEFGPPPDEGPMLFSEADTVEILLDSPEMKAEQIRQLEARLAELEAENARLKRLLGKLAAAVEG